MRIAYLDCFSGISGDMFLGALLDAGVREQVFKDAVSALNLGARLEISRVKRSGISATKVDVWVGDEKDQPREEYWARKNAHQHEHPHGEHDHGHGHGRGLGEIRGIIEGADISETAKRTAISPPWSLSVTSCTRNFVFAGEPFCRASLLQPTNVSSMTRTESVRIIRAV